MIRFLILLRYLWSNEDGFFGIGMGPSGQETTQYGETAGLANFATGQGELDVSTADNFWRSILSGNPQDIAKVLGPEFSSINKQTQQSLKTASEFGNRGGGTNAFAQTAGDTARSRMDQIVSSLTGGAASALGASGSSLLSTGLSGHEAAFSQANTIQQQRMAQLNDIFQSIASIGARFLPGAAGAAASAFPNMSPGAISASFGGPGQAETSWTPISQNTIEDED